MAAHDQEQSSGPRQGKQPPLAVSQISTGTRQCNNSDTGSDTTSPESPTPPLAHLRLLILLLSLMLGVFLFALDMTIIANAVPSITASFHSLAHVTWYSSAFFLTTAPLQSAYGKAYRYFDQKNTFLASIAIFEAGNLLAGFATNSPMLIAGRAVSGIGGGGIITGSFTIIAGAAPPRRVPACMGVLGVTFGLASVVGPLLGGALTSGPGWRWCFWINLPLGAVAAGMTMLVLTTPESARRPVSVPLRERVLQMDPAGIVLVLLGAGCFVLAMQLGSQSGNFAQPGCVGALVASGVVLLAFVGLEWHLGERAMIQYRLLRNAIVSANVAVNFFVAAAYFPLMYILPIYFQSIKNASASTSGVWSIPFILGVSLFVTVSNTSMPKVHWATWLVIGPTIITAGTACLYTLGPDTSLAKALGYQLLTGAGIGLVLQVPIAANQGLVALADVSAVIGMTLFFETVGSVLFTAAVEASFVSRLVARVSGSAVLVAAGIASSTVLEAGATGIRTLFPGNVAVVLDCYMDGIQTALLIELVCAAVSLLLACVAFVVYFGQRRRHHSSSSGAEDVAEQSREKIPLRDFGI